MCKQKGKRKSNIKGMIKGKEKNWVYFGKGHWKGKLGGKKGIVQIRKRREREKDNTCAKNVKT